MTEGDSKWIMLWSCIGVSLVYYVTPEDTEGRLISFFPFSDQQLTLRSYAYFAVVYASKMLYVLTVSEFAEKTKRHRITFQILFFMEIAAMVNFLTRYGTDFIPGIDMTSIRVFVVTIAAGVNIILNRRNLKYENR